MRVPLVCIVLLLPVLGGCSSSGLFVEDAPRFRLGSMPFPGWMTLYEPCDPTKLGRHQSGPSRFPFDDHADETSRGIMYTCLAGFLDLSHIRETIDWAKVIHDLSIPALQTGEPYSFEHVETRFDVTVTYPDWWNTIAADERKSIIHEAAVQFAQRTAMNVSTWHEVATWYGYQTIPGISEQRSAFTWDDTTSHVVAANIAGVALRSDGEFDDAVTLTLDRTLRELGVVDRTCEKSAVQSVKDLWWRNSEPIRRDLDIGLSSGVKHPWRAPNLSCCEPLGDAGIPVPDLNPVHGHDVRSLLTVTITPRPWLHRRTFGEDPSGSSVPLEPALLEALERVRADIKERWGERADQPI